MFGFKKLRNNSRRRRPAAKINGPESLETRELMTVTASVNSAGLLTVRGDEMPDKITVFQYSGNMYVQTRDAANIPTNRNMGSGVTSLDIRTFGGNDSVTNLTNLKSTILTGNGDDTVVGGSNDDLIYTEAGNDTAVGNNGNDSIYGGAGMDRLFGKDGNDNIMGDDWTLNALTPAQEQAINLIAFDLIFGGRGNDLIYGQNGSDTIYGEGDSDTISGGRGNDALWGDDANNSEFFGPENKGFTDWGTAHSWGDDTVRGDDGNDTVSGGTGNDVLRGGWGNDQLFGGTTAVSFLGAQDSDRIYGDGGIDSLWGHADNDFLDAGSSTEFADGGDGNDFNAWVTAVNGAAFDDIAQGNSNNCFIIASMSAAARKGIDLASRITYMGNNNYDVALFQRVASGGYASATVTVFFDGTLRSTDPTAHFRAQEGESWPIIMNRAIAQLINIDLNVTGGGYAGYALEAITGTAPQSTTWIDNTLTSSTMVPDGFLAHLHAVGNARPTVVATRNTPGELSSNLFVADHVYAVHSVILSGYIYSPITRIMVPQYTVILYNPWGTDNRYVNIWNGTGSASGDNLDGLLVISGAEFKRNFDEITFT